MTEGPGENTRKRTRLVRPYPVHTLEESLSIAGAIQRSNSGLPFDRQLLARALGTTPASSSFTMRLNSSAKYGLTQGGYNDDRILITPRGEATVAPKGEDERRRALLEASLEPDVFRRFYEVLDGRMLPEEEFARNLLQRELGIRPDLTSECFRILEANGLFTGVLERLDSGSVSVVLAPRPDHRTETITPIHPVPATEGRRQRESVPPQTGRVFIGNSASDDATQYVRSVLDDFGVPYSVGEVQPGRGPGMSEEVSAEMRRCSAAVLVLGDDGGDSVAGQGLAARVLYQLGAASVLYGPNIVIIRGASLDLAPDLDAGLRSIVFEPTFPERTGMALLAGLRALGVIEVIPGSGP
ncbi:MAG: nucleotide-binding protein [Chloroflexi bacterium]|nr:nucleotide-binding protein [Chloroflexota bacterium]